MDRPTLDKFPTEILAQIDIQKAFMISRLINTCEKLQVFRVMQGKQLTSAAIGKTLKIHKRYLKIFLDILVSLGLLDKKGDLYKNTTFTEKYFIRERSIWWTLQFTDECVDAYESLTVLERALLSGRRCQSYKEKMKANYVESMRHNPRTAERFTMMLYDFHKGDAAALADYLDLRKYHSVLDVGGGSGIMSISLAKRNRHLRACILDIPPVCKIAIRNIHSARLDNRITTMIGDINEPFPLGHDVIMFCDIGPISKRMLQNAAKALLPGGMVVLVDRYLSADGTTPLDRLVEQLVSASFGSATHTDMKKILASCGFLDVVDYNGYKDVWFITGTKADGNL